MTQSMHSGASGVSQRHPRPARQITHDLLGWCLIVVAVIELQEARRWQYHVGKIGGIRWEQLQHNGEQVLTCQRPPQLRRPTKPSSARC